MPLSPHTRLGPYEIISSIGAGGMGEVYRARDARLGREVALKTLPSSDPGRVRRFEQDAPQRRGRKRISLVVFVGATLLGEFKNV